MSVNYIPKGLHTITPYLLTADVDKLTTFIKTAFDAVVEEQTKGFDEKIAHAQLRIGDSVVMVMLDEKSSASVNQSMLYVYVKDTDVVYKQALAAGGTSIMEPKDQFYGDRNAAVQDCCGHQWWIATRFENVSQEELQERVKALKNC